MKEEIFYTDEEIKEFTRLVELGESKNQIDRIKSRQDMPKFIQKHGKEKCDLMFKKIS